ncbi:MAG: two domain fusion protein (N:Methyl-accepting chemotaxis protein-C:sensory box histidine kinase/response regulator), partial [Parcubacteria group bacterium LiPW_30]
IIFKAMEVQYAVPKGRNTFVIDALDSNLRKLKMTEGSLYHRLKDKFLSDPLPLEKEMSTRDLLIALCICLLLIIFGIIMGRFMAKKIETGNRLYSRPYIRDIIVFTLSISLSFWVFDSMMLWFSFNDKHKLTLLELTLTNIPPENMYIRGMFFLLCCFFGLFLAKYISRYEEMYHFLLVSVNRFERLTDNAKDMIFHMALPSGRYEYVSKASSQIFGYSPEEFHQKPLLIQELIHPLWITYFRSQWKNLLDGKIPSYYEFQVINKEGEVRWVNQRNTLYFDESGVPNALEGIITDVTEQKSATTKQE